MSATMYMLTAVLAFSLYPLIMIYGSPMGAGLFLLCALTFSTIIAFIIQTLYLRNNPLAKTAISTYFANAKFDDYLFLTIIGITTVLTHIFFIISLSLMSKVGASIIYESWPIFSMFLAPLIIRKTWKYRLRLHDYAGGILAGFGIVLISLSDQNLTFKEGEGLLSSFDVYTLIGAVLALMGGIMLALFVNFRTEFSNRLQKSSDDLKDTMTVCIIGEFICRAATLPFLVIAVLFIPEDGTTTLKTIMAALIFGGFILYVGNVAFTAAMLKASSPSIQILWYITPAIAIIWLYAFGLSEITSLIIAGALFIIVGNIMVAISKKKQKPS